MHFNIEMQDKYIYIGQAMEFYGYRQAIVW